MAIEVLWDVDWRVLGAVLFALFSFGFGYNALVGERADAPDGTTAVYVVGGVLITLLGALIVVWNTRMLGQMVILVVLLCFVADGIPMLIGNVSRDAERRRRQEEHHKRVMRIQASEILGMAGSKDDEEKTFTEGRDW